MTDMAKVTKSKQRRVNCKPKSKLRKTMPKGWIVKSVNL